MPPPTTMHRYAQHPNFFRNRRRRKQWNAFVDSDAFIWITCGLAVLGTVLLSYV